MYQCIVQRKWLITSYYCSLNVPRSLPEELYLKYITSTSVSGCSFYCEYHLHVHVWPVTYIATPHTVWWSTVCTYIMQNWTGSHATYVCFRAHTCVLRCRHLWVNGSLWESSGHCLHATSLNHHSLWRTCTDELSSLVACVRQCLRSVTVYGHSRGSVWTTGSQRFKCSWGERVGWN